MIKATSNLGILSSRRVGLSRPIRQPQNLRLTLSASQATPRLIRHNSSIPPPYTKPPLQPRSSPSDPHQSSSSSPSPPPPPNASLISRLSHAWRTTPTKWYPIPIALGALVLIGVQFRKAYRDTGDALEVESQREGAVVRSRKLDGPWQVRVLGALPLRSLSQLWGYLNGLVLPVWFRPFGFRLYSRIFGCNLEECAVEDLTQYESLGEFFYRELKDGLRPIADAPMVSPADGRVLHFGEITGERVEQVKGITYSLGALLGSEGSPVGERKEIGPAQKKAKITQVDDAHFAEINDIPYSLDSLLGTGNAQPVKDPKLPPKPAKTEHDASHPTDTHFGHDATVAATLGSTAITKATEKGTELTLMNPANKLHFLVVYLAPGDYHRFHSPCAWVVERRRHFTGDLFSVSPYIANRMKDLFVLNERVAMLGRWRYGFFSMVPVGATNVGSIRINFDEALRTNTRIREHPAHTFTEAVYSSASVLRGQPLLAGEEMGGFRLGSTIVLVFEAPKNWKFTVEAGKTIKVGEALGRFE